MGTSVDEFYAELDRRHLVSLWRIVGRLMPSQPQPGAVAYLWRWKDLQALFSIHDIPVIQALGLYREKVYDAQGRHQPIEGEFAG